MSPSTNPAPDARAAQPTGDKPAGPSRWLVVATEYALLLGFWLVLSGRLDPLFLGMGVASAALVTACTHDIVARSLGPVAGGLRAAPVRAWRFARFAVWVLGQIPTAGLQIAYYVLHPRMPVEPCILRFATHLESQVARTLLANTITLIPGTLTVAVEDRMFTVHAFVPHFADDLVSADLQNRIAAVFLQDPEAPPEVTWQRRDDVTREVAR